MKNTENQNWEDHWKKELTNHKSPTTADDWSGMKHLLETQTTKPVEALIDPNLPRLPESDVSWILKFWPQNLLVFLLIGGLGFGLNQCRADDIVNEIIFSEEADIPVDFSKEADTLVIDYNARPRPSFSPESAAPTYRFDTIYRTDDLGNLTTEIARIDSSVISRGTKAGLH